MNVKLYERFTPEERAQLYLAALTRGDRVDAKLLLDTCSKKIVKVRDPAFVVAAKLPDGQSAVDLLAPEAVDLTRETVRNTEHAIDLGEIDDETKELAGEAIEALLMGHTRVHSAKIRLENFNRDRSRLSELPTNGQPQP